MYIGVRCSLWILFVNVIFGWVQPPGLLHFFVDNPLFAAAIGWVDPIHVFAFSLPCLFILLMEEILHHLGWLKPYK